MAESYELFRALGDPSREAMVEQLGFGPATVGELGAGLGLSKAAVSKHVKVLIEVGLISTQKIGRTTVCTLEPEPLSALADWLTDRWAYLAMRTGSRMGPKSG